MSDAPQALTVAEALLGREVVKNHLLTAENATQQAQFSAELAGIRAEIDAMKGAASGGSPISGSAEIASDEEPDDPVPDNQE